MSSSKASNPLAQAADRHSGSTPESDPWWNSIKPYEGGVPITFDSVVGEWPPCRDQFVDTACYEDLKRELGHLAEG